MRANGTSTTTFGDFHFQAWEWFWWTELGLEMTTLLFISSTTQHTLEGERDSSGGGL